MTSVTGNPKSDVRHQSWLAWAGDRINPILVKETRQALKSRQFIATFGLLLLAAWAATIIAVAQFGAEIWYGAIGGQVFFFYYVILALPLLVVVPFGAMRSLAGEHEERTYDLLSITTLGPRQIVSGKLGSAALQILIYVSAVSPCLAFTYLLRGVDLVTILFILCYTVLLSLGLSMVGILAGTLSTEKHWQIVLGVLAVGGLMMAFGGAVSMAEDILRSARMPYADPEFWMAMAAMMTAYVSYFALAFFAAASRLTFASGNRSTALRTIVLVQFMLLTGWITWIWFGPWPVGPQFEVLAVYLVMAGIHWYVMGVFMTGESPELSLRVRRRLPQSFLGRAFLTWFNPGPGTGYMFAVSGVVAALLSIIGLIAITPAMLPKMELNILPGVPSMPRSLPTAAIWSAVEVQSVLAVGACVLFYVMIYLGVGLLILRFLRRFTVIGVLTPPLIHGLLLLAGTATPLVIQQMSPQLRRWDWSFLQITNVPWTVTHLIDHPRQGPPGDTLLLLLVLGVMALALLVLNMPGIAREVRHVRIEPPRRLVEEELELHPPKKVRTSPWD